MLPIRPGQLRDYHEWGGAGFWWRVWFPEGGRVRKLRQCRASSSCSYPTSGSASSSCPYPTSGSASSSCSYPTSGSAYSSPHQWTHTFSYPTSGRAYSSPHQRTHTFSYRGRHYYRTYLLYLCPVQRGQWNGM